MPNFITTIQYKLFGNIYSNQNNIVAADPASARANIQAQIQAMSLIQTPDVHYLKALITYDDAPYVSFEVVPVVTQGQAVGGNTTAPGGNFLIFTLHKGANRGFRKLTIRGYPLNGLTQQSTFQLAEPVPSDSTADTATDPVISYTSSLSGFCISMVELIVDHNYITFNSYSARIDTGYRRGVKKL